MSTENVRQVLSDIWRIKSGKVFPAALVHRNLNQLIKGIHETCHLYGTDLAELQERQKQLWDTTQKILASLAAIR